METMFDTILQLPLFQGLCLEDLTAILGRVKLHFERIECGESVVKAGTPCEQFCFLLRGELEMVTSDSENSFTVFEKYSAPYLIEPYRLFGMQTVFRSDYMATTDCSIVTVGKQAILEELFKYEIFRLNYANIVCSRAQYLYDKIWLRTPVDVEKKMILFFLNHIDRMQGEKRFRVKMVDLARHLDNTRLNISKALNSLHERGLIELRRREIVIKDASLLLDCLAVSL